MLSKVAASICLVLFKISGEITAGIHLSKLALMVDICPSQVCVTCGLCTEVDIVGLVVFQSKCA